MYNLHTYLSYHKNNTFEKPKLTLKFTLTQMHSLYIWILLLHSDAHHTIEVLNNYSPYDREGTCLNTSMIAAW